MGAGTKQGAVSPWGGKSVQRLGRGPSNLSFFFPLQEWLSHPLPSDWQEAMDLGQTWVNEVRTGLGLWAATLGVPKSSRKGSA